MRPLTPENAADRLLIDAVQRYHHAERFHHRARSLASEHGRMKKFADLARARFRDAETALIEALMARDPELAGFDLRALTNSDMAGRGVRIGKRLYLVVDDEAAGNGNNLMSLVVVKCRPDVERVIRLGTIEDLTGIIGGPGKPAEGPEEGGEDAVP